MTAPSCPCCGGLLAPGQIVVDLVTGIAANARAQSEPMQTRVAMFVEALLRRHSATHEQLIEYLWRVDGEPPDPAKSLQGYACKARHALAPLGFGIKSTRNIGYALTEVPQIAGADA